MAADRERRQSGPVVRQRAAWLRSEVLAELPEERTPTREDWAHLSEAWRSELEERIKQLNRLRDHLTDCIGCGCLSLDTCVLSNPGDVFGERRAGSRLMVDKGRA